MKITILGILNEQKTINYHNQMEGYYIKENNNKYDNGYIYWDSIKNNNIEIYHQNNEWNIFIDGGDSLYFISNEPYPPSIQWWQSKRYYNQQFYLLLDCDMTPSPTLKLTINPTIIPTETPTNTDAPTTLIPTDTPTNIPTDKPTFNPTLSISGSKGGTSIGTLSPIYDILFVGMFFVFYIYFYYI